MKIFYMLENMVIPFYELILKIQLRAADKSAALKEILLPLKKIPIHKKGA